MRGQVAFVVKSVRANKSELFNVVTRPYFSRSSNRRTMFSVLMWATDHDGCGFGAFDQHSNSHNIQ